MLRRQSSCTRRLYGLPTHLTLFHIFPLQLNWFNFTPSMQRILESSEFISDECLIDGEIIQLVLIWRVNFYELQSSSLQFWLRRCLGRLRRIFCAWEWHKLLIYRRICIKHAEGFEVSLFTPQHSQRWKIPPLWHETDENPHSLLLLECDR